MGRRKIIEKVKNYKQLCEFFGLKPVSGGKNRKLQLIDLERYGEFKKSEKGNSYIIYKKYTEPLPKTSTKGFQKYIQDLIIDLMVSLLDKNTKSITLSTNELLIYLNMINNNYCIAKNNIPLFAEQMNLDVNMCYDYFFAFEGVNNILTSKIKTALEALEKNGWIYVEKEMWICKKIDDENKKIKYKYKKATEKDICDVLKIKREAFDEILKENKITDIETYKYPIKWIYKHNKYYEYKKKTDIIAKKYNIEFYYNKFTIHINNYEFINYNKKIDRHLKAEYFNTLNTKTFKTISKLIENNHKRALEICNVPENYIGDKKQIIEMSNVYNNIKIHASDSYIRDATKISNKVIKRRYSKSFKADKL